MTRSPQYTLDDLLAIMAKLRDPDTGCPWDRKQTYATIVPHTLEEAYEVADAIARGDLEELRDELGDLLFQIVFYAQLGREQGIFMFDDVVEAICHKLVRRHPHVFGDAEYESEEALHREWERGKQREREGKTARASGVLDGVAAALPALSRAQKLQSRAARVGFDWPEPGGVLAKCREELDELEAALARGEAARLEIAAEAGDLMFSLVNLTRHLRLDAEQVLRGANDKFERRFRAMEAALLEQGVAPAEASARQMGEIWEAVKAAENG